eukprot:1298781-Rhodomonas_salina.1
MQKITQTMTGTQQDAEEVPVEDLPRLKVLSLSNNKLPELPSGTALPRPDLLFLNMTESWWFCATGTAR